MNDTDFVIDAKVMIFVEFFGRMSHFGCDQETSLFREVVSDVSQNGFAAETIASLFRLIGVSCRLVLNTDALAVINDDSDGPLNQEDWFIGLDYDRLDSIVVCHPFHFSVLQIREVKGIRQWGWYEWKRKTVITFQSLRTMIQCIRQIVGFIFVDRFSRDEVMINARALSETATRGFTALGAMIVTQQYSDDPSGVSSSRSPRGDDSDEDDDDDDISLVISNQTSSAHNAATQKGRHSSNST
jgi:hypothetical protein